VVAMGGAGRAGGHVETAAATSKSGSGTQRWNLQTGNVKGDPSRWVGGWRRRSGRAENALCGCLDGDWTARSDGGCLSSVPLRHELASSNRPGCQTPLTLSAARRMMGNELGCQVKTIGAERVLDAERVNAKPAQRPGCYRAGLTRVRWQRVHIKVFTALPSTWIVVT
jgi:hypothetical protein